MKSLLQSAISFLFPFLLFGSLVQGQPVTQRPTKLQLNDDQLTKLKTIKPIPISDTFLVRRGYNLYSGEEVTNKAGIDLKNKYRYTLEDIRKKINGNGKLPLMAPLCFQQNVGQANAKFNFITRSVSYAIGFSPQFMTMVVLKKLNQENETTNPVLQGNLVNLYFEKSTGKTLVGKKAIGTAINHYIGDNKSQWHEKIQGYSYLANENLYKGITLLYEAKEERLEYMLMIEPKTDIKKIRIQVDGAKKLSIDKKGNLIMHTSGGPVVQTKPRFYDLTSNGQKEIRGEFILLDEFKYGFKVMDHDPTLRLVIDPEIVFTTYFGGTGQEGMLLNDQGAGDFIGQGFDVKIGNDGNIYVVGMTVSPDFPVTGGGAINGSADAFAMRIDPTLPTGQNLIYATFIGGTSSERGRSIEVLDDGSAYITGHSSSTNFPTTPGVIQPVIAGSGAYIAKLTPEGEFEIGTYLGSARSNHPNSIVFNRNANDPGGHIYVAGSTQSLSGSDATVGSFQPDFAGGQFDGFITKLELSLDSINYFTYLGGSGRDVIMDLDVMDGFAFVTGMTASTDFPTTDFTFQEEHSSTSIANCSGTLNSRECAEAFLARILPDGSGLTYSTYFGEAGREDFARGIAVNSSRQAYITGASKPITGDQTQIFVAKFEAGGENLLWHQTLQAIGRDHGEELVVDQFGNAHVTGTISVDGLSTGIGANTFLGGTSDIFYARFTAQDGDNNFFTYLGGGGTDRGFAVAAVASSETEFCATIVGSTVSDNINTINPLEGGDVRSGSADLLILTLCNAPPSLNQGDFIKSAPNTVTRGGPITYTITVVNGSDVPIPVTVTDNVPGTITVNGVAGTGCTRIGNNITCSFLAQPGGNSIVITGVVASSANPDNCVPLNITNTATIEVGSRTFTSSATTFVQCEPRRCGNGVLDDGEECDGTPGCRSNCTLRRCGDGIVDPGEECDDGNNNNTDHCRNCDCVDLRRELCTTGDNCSCEPGTSCNQAFVGIIECSCFDGCFLCVMCESYCGEVLLEADRRCNSN